MNVPHRNFGGAYEQVSSVHRKDTINEANHTFTYGRHTNFGSIQDPFPVSAYPPYPHRGAKHDAHNHPYLLTAPHGITTAQPSNINTAVPIYHDPNSSPSFDGLHPYSDPFLGSMLPSPSTAISTSSVSPFDEAKSHRREIERKSRGKRSRALGRLRASLSQNTHKEYPERGQADLLDEVAQTLE